MRKHQVRVKAAKGGEAPIDDGHSWRKYGQKTILGAQYPRLFGTCHQGRSLNRILGGASLTNSISK
jgi:hypothetical protein